MRFDFPCRTRAKPQDARTKPRRGHLIPSHRRFRSPHCTDCCRNRVTIAPFSPLYLGRLTSLPSLKWVYREAPSPLPRRAL